MRSVFLEFLVWLKDWQFLSSDSDSSRKTVCMPGWKRLETKSESQNKEKPKTTVSGRKKIGKTLITGIGCYFYPEPRGVTDTPGYSAAVSAIGGLK